MKVKLIEGWEKAYKLFTIQLAAILALLDIAYEYLPAVQTYLPEGWVKWFALAIIVGRVVKQKNGAPNVTP